MCGLAPRAAPNRDGHSTDVSLGTARSYVRIRFSSEPVTPIGGSAPKADVGGSALADIDVGWAPNCDHSHVAEGR